MPQIGQVDTGIIGGFNQYPNLMQQATGATNIGSMLDNQALMRQQLAQEQYGMEAQKATGAALANNNVINPQTGEYDPNLALNAYFKSGYATPQGAVPFAQAGWKIGQGNKANAQAAGEPSVIQKNLAQAGYFQGRGMLAATQAGIGDQTIAKNALANTQYASDKLAGLAHNFSVMDGGTITPEHYQQLQTFNEGFKQQGAFQADDGVYQELQNPYSPSLAAGLEKTLSGFSQGYQQELNTGFQQQGANAKDLDAQAKWYAATHPKAATGSPYAGVVQDRTIQGILGQSNTELDPMRAATGNSFGQLAYSTIRAQGATGLLNRFADNLTPQEMPDYGAAVYALISRSNRPNEQMIKDIIPASAQGSIAGVRNWISNDPQGTDQQRFLQRGGQTIQAEATIAGNQIKATQYQRLTQFKGRLDAMQADPSAYTALDANAKAYGIDPDDHEAWVAAGSPSFQIQPTYDEKGNIVNPGGDWKPKTPNGSENGAGAPANPKADAEMKLIQAAKTGDPKAQTYLKSQGISWQ